MESICVNLRWCYTKMIASAEVNAKKAGITNVVFQVQNAYNLTFESDCFDYVIISNTLHIMPEPIKALAEIKRVLRPSGKMIALTSYMQIIGKQLSFQKSCLLPVFVRIINGQSKCTMVFLQRINFLLRFRFAGSIIPNCICSC